MDLELFSPQAISLDWLSIYCLGTVADTPEYKFIQQEYQTRHFKKVFKIQYKNKMIGTATAEPHSKIINSRAVIVKFENALLYVRSAGYFIQKFLKETKLFFKSITRADIARDFLKFANNIQPQNFIKSFFDGTLLKNGRGKFYTIGEQKQDNVFDYLSFGSNTTGKRIYLYNKTKELSQVKDKPYIREFWKLNNLDTGAAVWRLEFSFKGSQNKLIDELTGMIEKLHWTDLFKLERLIEILQAAIKNLFSFKVNDGTKNKSRMDDVILFNENDTHKRLMKLPDEEDNIKPIKILLKNLSKEFDATPPHNYKELFILHYTIVDIAQRHKLLDYLTNVIHFNIQKLSNPFKTNLSNENLQLI